MKRKLLTLISMLAITTILVAISGAYIKYDVLASVQRYQKESVLSVPFMLMTDDAAQYAIKRASMPTEPPAETEPTEPAPEQVTTPPTMPVVEVLPTEPIFLELDESWFDDTLFIGNSLMVGFRDFARLGKADYFANIGMTLYSVWDDWSEDQNYISMQLATLLQIKSYEKIFIHLGTNELGYPFEDLVVLYQDLIDRIRAYQPDALIVIQGIMTVGRIKEANIYYVNPTNVYALNELFAELADGDRIRYIDVNEWCADEEGYLPDAFSSDGCHPYATGYYDWSRWVLDKCGEFGIP